jgi:glycosyltransferase involved in cell wall biosynthesis
MNVTLSGCVPFYNTKSTIVSALQSLADQSVPINELFGLDDGSTDGGQQLLVFNGFRCLHQPTNLGRGAARNRAISEATGDLVVFCDATNVLPKEFVGSLLHWFDDPNVQNTLWQVMERYCRWYFGDDHHLSYSVFIKSVAYSLTVMFKEDLRNSDFKAGLISLLLPYYRLFRSL